MIDGKDIDSRFVRESSDRSRRDEFVAIDDEIRRVTRHEGSTGLVPDERLIDGREQVADHIFDTIVVCQT
jgi:hypothetical protein